MGIVQFTKAQRDGSHVIAGIVGESGSGKTFSAILLGRGLVGPQGKLAMLDTETGRGKMYASMAGGYDYGELTPPFTPERYIDAIKGAEEAGYQALIIDSGSHEWEGLGGTLEIAEAGRSKNGEPLKGLVKWAQPKARHKRFVQALLTTRMHLIICLRAKEKMRQVGNDIISDGYVSIQDKRFVYETTFQLFMPNDDPVKRGVPRLDKCPEDLLSAFPAGQKINLETGAKIAQWIAGGTAVNPALAALKQEANDAADEGTEALKTLWAKLTKPQQTQLKPFMDNLKSIASTADADNAANAPVLFGPVTDAAE